MKYGEEMYAVLSMDPATGQTSLASYSLYTLEEALEKADGYNRYYAANTRFDGRKCDDAYFVAKVEVTGDMAEKALDDRRKADVKQKLAKARAVVEGAGSRLERAQENYDRALAAVEGLEEELDG